MTLYIGLLPRGAEWLQILEPTVRRPTLVEGELLFLRRFPDPALDLGVGEDLAEPLAKAAWQAANGCPSAAYHYARALVVRRRYGGCGCCDLDRSLRLGGYR